MGIFDKFKDAIQDGVNNVQNSINETTTNLNENKQNASIEQEIYKNERAAKKQAKKQIQEEAKLARMKYDEENNKLLQNMVVSGSNGGFKWDDINRFLALPSGLLHQSIVIKYDSIRNYRVDEQVVTTQETGGQTKRKGTIARATVGTLILPGAGTIVGGLTGKKVNNSTTTTNQEITRTIIITREDPYSPVISSSYNDALIMKLDQILSEHKQPTTEAATIVENTSIADEIIKLKSLLDAGILTQEEFDTQKSKLLG